MKKNNRLSHTDLTKLGKQIFVDSTALKPQSGPITSKQIVDMLGDDIVVGRTYSTSSPESYFESSKIVVQKYLNAISEKSKLSALGIKKFSGLSPTGIRETVGFLVQNENLDLSLLNKSEADIIVDSYRKHVLKINDTFKTLGLPGLSLPSENPYKHFLRYTTDPFSGVAPGEGVNPNLLNIMRTSYNPSVDARDVEDITTGRGRMRSPFSAERFYERTKTMFPDRVGDDLKGPMNHLGLEKGKKYTIITWDTETTGLTPEAQIRQIALVKRTVEYKADGTMVSSAPEILSNKSFASDLMNIAGYVDKDGNTIPLARAAFEAENGGPIDAAKMARFEEAYQKGGITAVEDFKEILRIFTNDGNSIENFRIEGHNAEAFDLDKLISTMQNLPAFQEDSEAKTLLKRFLDIRADRANPFYTLDTLDSAKLLMATQQSKLINILNDEALGLSEDLKSGLVSAFSISTEIFGLGKGTESLENLFLNTNFFELLEARLGADKSTDNLLEIMKTRGTHTAEVDTLLNSYISDFINNNELHIRRMPSARNATSWINRRRS